MQIADCLSRNSQRDSEWREDDEEMPAGIIKSEDLFVTESSAEMLVVQLEKGLYELSLSGKNSNLDLGLKLRCASFDDRKTA